MKKLVLITAIIMMINIITPISNVLNIFAITPISIGDYVTISHDRLYSNGNYIAYCYDDPQYTTPFFEAFYDSIGIVKEIRGEWIQIEFTGGSLYKANLVDNVPAHNFLKTPQKGWIKQGLNNSKKNNIVSKCENVKQLQRNIEDKYVHQCYSTQTGFTGRSACAPTACIIACAIFGKLEPKDNQVKRTPALSASSKPAFNVTANGYGFYVNNAYSVGQYKFDHEEEHQVSGNVLDKGKGAWGQINTMSTQADSRADSFKMQPFLEKHGLKVSDITTTYKIKKDFYTKVTEIIDKGGLVIIGGDGHYKVIVGHGRDVDYNTDFYIVLDPYGNKSLMRKQNYTNNDGYAVFNKVLYMYEDFSNNRTSDPVRILEVIDSEPDPCKNKPKPEVKINTFEYDSSKKKIVANWQLVSNECCDANTVKFDYAILVNDNAIKNVNDTIDSSFEMVFDLPKGSTTFKLLVTPKNCNGLGNTIEASDSFDTAGNNPTDNYSIVLDKDIRTTMNCDDQQVILMKMKHGDKFINDTPDSDRENVSFKFDIVKPVNATNLMLTASWGRSDVNGQITWTLRLKTSKQSSNCGLYKFKLYLVDKSTSQNRVLCEYIYDIKVEGNCCCQINSIILQSSSPKQIECGNPATFELKIDKIGCDIDVTKDLSYELLGPDVTTKINFTYSNQSLDDQGILKLTLTTIDYKTSATLYLIVKLKANTDGEYITKPIPLSFVCACTPLIAGINNTEFISGISKDLIVDVKYNNCAPDFQSSNFMVIETYLSNPPSGDPYKKYEVMQPTKIDASLYKYNTLIRFDTCVSAVGTVRVSLLKADKTLLTLTDHRVTITHNGPVRTEISPDLPLMLEVGKTEQFKVTLYDSSGMVIQNSSAGCGIAWTSTDPSKVTVDNNGKVKALMPGFTDIFAVVTCGSCNQLETKKITIQVYPKPVLVAKIKDGKLPYIDLECEKTLPFEIYAYDSMVEKNAPYKVDYLNNSSLFRITVEQLVTNPNDNASFQKPLPIFNNSELMAVNITYRYPIRVTVQYRNETTYVDVMIFKVAKIDIDRSILVVAPNKSYNLSMFAYDEYGQVLNRFTQNDFKMEVVTDYFSIIDKLTGKGVVVITNSAPNKATASMRISLANQCTKAYKLFNVLVLQKIKRIETIPAKKKVSIGEKIMVTVIAYDEDGKNIANPDIQNTILNDDGSILIFSHKNSDGTESFYEFVTTGCNSKEIIFFWINDPNVKTGVRIDVWLPKQVLIDPPLIKGKPGENISIKLFVIDENNRTIPGTSFRWEFDQSLGYVLPSLDGSANFILGNKTCDKLTYQDENKLRVWTQGLCIDVYGESFIFIESIQPLNLDFDIVCINDNALIEVGSWISLGVIPINLACTGDLYINSAKVDMIVAVQANVKTLVPYQMLPGKNCLKFKIVSHQKNNSQTVEKEKEVCFYGSSERRREFIIDKPNGFATINGAKYVFPACNLVRSNNDKSKPFPNSPSFGSYLLVKRPKFIWLLPNTKVVSYLLQFSTDSSFKKVFDAKGRLVNNNSSSTIGIETTNASWVPTFDLFKGGLNVKYYWRIRTIISVVNGKKTYSGFSVSSEFTLTNNKPRVLTTEPENINGTNFTGLRDLCELGLGVPSAGMKCKYCNNTYTAIDWNQKTQTATIELHKHYDILPSMNIPGVNPVIFKLPTSNSYFDKVIITVQANNPVITYELYGSRINNRGIVAGNNMPYEFVYKQKLIDSAKPFISKYCNNVGRLMIPMSPFFKGLTKSINLVYYWNQNNPNDTYDIDNPDLPPGASSIFTPFEKDGEHIKNGCFCIEDSVYWDDVSRKATFKYVP